MPNDRRHKTTVIRLPEHREVAIVQPEHVLLQLGETQKLDIGALCYLKRDSTWRGGRHANGVQVDENTFQPKRRALVRRLVTWLSDELEMGVRRPISLRGRTQVFVNLFMGWADNAGHIEAVESFDAARDAFSEYVDYLREQVMLGNLSLVSAARFQYATSSILSALVESSERELLRGLHLLRHDDTLSVPTEPPDELEQSKVLSLCSALFEGLSTFVLQTKKYPFSLTVPEYLKYPGNALWIFPVPRWCSPPGTAVDLKGTFKKGCAYNYEEGRVPRVDEIEKYFTVRDSAVGAVRSSNALIAKANGDPRHHARLERAVAAQQAFFVLFIANTGFNLQQAIELTWNDKFSVSKERQGFRTLKWRANGKPTTCEIQTTFFPSFRKFLVLREYLLDGEIFPYLFFKLGQHASGAPEKLQANYPILAKTMLLKVDPTLPHISPRKWRAAMSDWAVRHHDPTVAASLLQNSERTVLKHYAAGSTATHLAEMGAYFRGVSNVVLARAEPLPNAVSRATGLCTDFGHPKILEVSEALPAPDCRKPEGCLFCEKYRLHADETDIRKLLSCQFCMRAMSSLAPDQEQYERLFGTVFARIDALIEMLRKHDFDLVERIRIEVENGELDPYWTGKFELLQELELTS